MDRRDFLKFVGMASSATILSSCGVEKSTEKIIPMVVPPEDPNWLPGEAFYTNSTCTECPANCGVSVKVVDFNPIKLEGISDHPLNDGALCMRGQSSLMRLYHPERIKSPVVPNKDGLKLDQMSGGPLKSISWDEAYQMALDAMNQATTSGRKNAYLAGRTTGSLSELIDTFCSTTGTERLPEYEAFAHANLRAAYQALFGRNEIPAYKIAESDFLLSIGADLLETFVNPTYNATQLKQAREMEHFHWVHAEPHASLTGFQANERVTLKPGSEAYFLLFLLNYVTGNNLSANNIPASIQSKLPSASDSDIATKTGLSEDELNAIGQKMAEAKNPLLIAGGVSSQQANGLEVSLLAGLLQWTTGMAGKTVDFSQGQDYSNVGTLNDIKSLTQRLNGNEIGVLFISGTDPVATTPGGLNVAESLANASFRIALTDVMTETAAACDLVLPLSHTYESWGDTEPRKGLLSIIQPALKETLFDTKSEVEILLNLTEKSQGQEATTSGHDWLKNKWNSKVGEGSLEAALKAGYYQTDTPAASLSLNRTALISALGNAVIDGPGYATVLYALPSIRAYDGRSNVLPLAKEVPDPLTTVSYGQWISVSEEIANDIKLNKEKFTNKHREVVKVEAGTVSMSMPALVQPGMKNKVATTTFDQIDKNMLSVDERSGECIARIDGVSANKTGAVKALAIMAGDIEQGHRNIVREDHPHEIPWLRGDETLYPDPYDRYTEYRWSISVDMESCTGCSACVAACAMENNVPCVGEEENLKGREMSWIRVQPYYHDDGTLDNLIMLCQQCDFAPCENVCPVYATYHNEEGLNVMVYNRCVGTRYCHNNCPYKVRRFNWFDWTDEGAWAEPMTRMLNPEVWTRPKGVMEKCTFCVQRIRDAKEVAKDEGRKVQDGEVTPACAQTCPTNAITFGNLLDHNSEVYKKSQSDRAFRVLEVLGTGPAVHYLRKEEHA